MIAEPRNDGLEAVFNDQVAHIRELPPREGEFAEPSAVMHPGLKAKLAALEIKRLYSHQAAAYDAAIAGKNLVVVTGTNSGKTLCYNLPALQFAITEPAARMLYLFPTKALAQDQLGKLEALLPGEVVRTGTYDGDTPKSQRAPIRKLAHIVLTNPDMLHIGILPAHELWAKFFKALRLIVIDEMHVYRGVFGSHVGGVLRRLLRLCEWHHSRPQIIACTATIGNPEELFQKLTGRQATLIDNDGAPRAKRTFIFWNPPMVGENQRLSANIATSEILASLAENGLRALAFNRARVSAELVLKYTRRRLEASGKIPPKVVESYRAGYTAKDRRKIESDLFTGKLLGLSATNAMELGVDIGGLDAVIMNGYPGTVSSFWQQAGRAGRGNREGTAIMVAHDDPLEQYLIRDPRLVLDAANESVSANPENPQILSQQLLCAAHERAISPSELDRFGSGAIEVAEGLDRSGELEFRAGMFFYPSHEPPAQRVSIRGSSGELIALMIDGKELGTMERWRAMQSAHEGAVYLHRGETFLVTELDLAVRNATIIPFTAEYYTQAIVQSVIEPKVTVRRQPSGNTVISLAGVSVTDMVIGFRKKTLDGDTVLGVEPLDLPPTTYETVCVRVDFPALDLDGEVGREIAGVHGVQHALMAVAPLIAGCDRGDIGSAWYSAFPGSGGPALFVFDHTPGGVGLCEKLYENYDKWAVAALGLLETCECANGCPACLLSLRCESNNDCLDKPFAVGLLRRSLFPEGASLN